MSSHIETKKVWRVFCDNRAEHFIEQKEDGVRVYDSEAFSPARSVFSLPDARKKNRKEGWRQARIKHAWKDYRGRDKTFTRTVDLCPSCAGLVEDGAELKEKSLAGAVLVKHRKGG